MSLNIKFANSVRHFEFRVQIRNERPQKLWSTNFHLNQVKFLIFVRHIGPAILNFQIFTSKSDSASPKTPK